MFKTEMVQAILRSDRPKTETLRDRGLDEINSYPDLVRFVRVEHGHRRTIAVFEHQDGRTIPVQCFYGKPGDELYVKETYAIHGDTVVYKANNPSYNIPWSGSMVMPERFSRIDLSIEDIGITRLHQMDDTHAKAEGVTLPDRACTMYNGIYRDAFFRLWDSIYGEGSSKRDMYLWRLTFKRTKP